MRSGIRVVFFVPCGILVLAATNASAQNVTPCVRVIRYSVQREVFVSTNRNPAPAYTATVKQSFEQTLPDGNTVHWATESTQARDENGRTLRQRIEGCDLDASGQPQLRMQVEIYDQAGQAFTSWSIGPGSMAIATVNHMQTNSQPNWKDIPRTPGIPYPRPEYTTENLGTRTIAGIEATGSRTTQIIPAGREGNDSPLKVVHETWMNRQNRTILLAIDDDPRTGRNTWEVENLTVGPPDPALFTPPANYKVWDPNAQPQTAAGTNR
ncbi:MAG TPA: hypothetical protein VGU25_15605 [Acidobacteriaceae bacterium]|nr:hypothetical protein [Acidobacteriaceae bacterium]